jgi:hypothetical protein
MATPGKYESKMSPEVYAAWMAARYKHGAYLANKEKPEHYVWRSMISRCTNPSNDSYHYYGGRGIKVCERWRSYENFITDMGDRPSADYSLERRDVSGDYTPENCYWTTRSVQQKNKTSTRLYTNGVFVGTLVECAAFVGISKALAYWRMKTWKTFDKGQSWVELQKAQ